MKGFISIATRGIINIESLSGIETVGNLSRHRTAPIVVSTSNGYEIRFVPVLSGESLAHFYQELLVEEAKKYNLPVGIRSQRFEFLKYSDEDLLKEEGINPPANENEIRAREVSIMLKDFIADVGGFLYAGAIPIKRTSCFQVGYAIPALHDIQAASLEAQFHVRFSPSQLDKQKPYNVEIGSAVYTFTFNLDLNRIGDPSTIFGRENEEQEKQLANQRQNRVKAALVALAKFYSSLAFGAKRSRFLPNIELLSAVASYSPSLNFVVSPGNSKEYIKRTKERADRMISILQKLNQNATIHVAAFDNENASQGVNIPVFNTIEGLIEWVISRATQTS